MRWSDKIAIIIIGSLILFINGSICYRKGRSDYTKEDNSVQTIINYQKANEFFKNGYYRYKGLYIQSEFENKHLRTDSAKCLRWTVTVYDNK